MDKIDPSVYERADEGLLKLLKKAETNALTEEEYDLYEASMKRLEDEIDMEQHGFERAIQLLIASGMPISEISERLNLSKDEIESLK